MHNDSLDRYVDRFFISRITNASCYVSPVDAGSHGVHLEMAANNLRALKFYHKLGFKVLDFEVDMATGEGLPPDEVLILGRQL